MSKYRRYGAYITSPPFSPFRYVLLLKVAEGVQLTEEILSLPPPLREGKEGFHYIEKYCYDTIFSGVGITPIAASSREGYTPIASPFFRRCIARGPWANRVVWARPGSSVE